MTKQALDEIEQYCAYIKAFNIANKVNKTNLDTIIDIISKAKDRQQWHIED